MKFAFAPKYTRVRDGVFTEVEQQCSRCPRIVVRYKKLKVATCYYCLKERRRKYARNAKKIPPK